MWMPLLGTSQSGLATEAYPTKLEGSADSEGESRKRCRARKPNDKDMRDVRVHMSLTQRE